MDSTHKTASFMDSVFSAEQQHEQEMEDSQAWWAVAGILFSIVGFGLVLGVSAVLLILSR